MRHDPYQVLDVERGAGPEELKRAFRRLARRFHPDQNPCDPEAAQQFREVVEAYGLLSDPAQRKAYDTHGWPGSLDDGPWRGRGESSGQGSGGSELGKGIRDFVGGVLGDLFGGADHQHGRDLSYTLEVSMAEAALGCDKTISFHSPVLCPDCHGHGGEPGREEATRPCGSCEGSGRVKVGPSILGATKTCPDCKGRGLVVLVPCHRCRGEGLIQRERHFSVKLPPRTEDGSLRVVPRKGAPGVGGGEPGDLQIHIKVANHPLLRKDGEDLICELPLSPAEAALGAVRDVPTLEGVLRVRIPQGSQAGRVLKLPGHGLMRSNGERGDQFIRLSVETPQGLNKPLEAALEKVAELLEPDHLPRRFDFQKKVDKLSRDPHR